MITPSFSRNCQIMKATKMSCNGEQINKPGYFPNGSAIICELPSHVKTQRKLKYILLSEKNESEMTTHHVQFYDLLEKQNYTNGKNDQRLPEIWGESKRNV